MSFIGTLTREFAYVSALLKTQKMLANLQPDATNLLADDWEATCARVASKPAIIFEGTRLTYGELDARANRFANWALGQGLKAGDVVALYMRNKPDYLAVWYGLAKVGVISALINHNLQGGPLVHCVTVAKSKAAIVDGELLETWSSASAQLANLPVWVTGGAGAAGLPGANDLDAALASASAARPPRSHREHLRGKDPCLYVYTSGTTGNPKAATLTQIRTQSMSRAFVVATQTNERDTVYVPLPLYHGTGGICGVGLAMNTGATLLIRRKFSASQFWDDIAENGVTVFAYIGELFRYLVAQPVHPKERAHKLKSCFGNGLRQDVWARADERFAIPKIAEFYGSTEGNVSFLNLDGKQGAIGRIAPYMRSKFNVEIVKFDIEEERPIRGADGFCIKADYDEPGEAIGKIFDTDTRGRFEGYANDPAATEKKILRDVFEKGDMWFRTGDLIKHDAQGYFYFVDRIGDTFRWKSENVSTNEVGEVLAMFPGIELANVYGVPVPHNDGKAGMAAIVVKGGSLDYGALLAHLRRELPAYAVPLFLRIQPEAEVTGTFKFRKVELVKEGFDPAAGGEPVLWLDPAVGSYVPVDAAALERLAAGGLKL